MKIIHTRYKHVESRNDSGNGWHPVNCGGNLDIVCEEAGVHVRCDECGEGWRFKFVVPRGHITETYK